MDVVMNLVIPNERGVWIECCNRDCNKWRYSLDFDDPLNVPNKWFCHMNSDKTTNSCNAPEFLELPEDEIFIESKYKAGCVVWAKVMGHAWGPAMVDFCPEFETYYWFDKHGSNVPTQYHVTFFGGKQVTRAWVKSGDIRSFIGNEDPSFALKSQVRNKKLTASMKKDILEGCQFARAALRLPLSRRLKKFNFNSWRLAQRCLDLPRGSDKGRAASSAGRSNAKNTKPDKLNQTVADKKSHSKKLAATDQLNKILVKPAAVPASVASSSAGRSNAKSDNNDTRPDKLKKTVADKNNDSKKLAATDQLNKILVKPAAVPQETKKPSRPVEKKLEKDLDKLGKSLKQKESVFVMPADIRESQDDLHSDTSICEDMNSIWKDQGSGNDTDDTRSINSVFSKDFNSETSVTKERSIPAAAKKPVEIKMGGYSLAGILADRNLLNEEIAEIVTGALEDIVLGSQESTPTKRPPNENSDAKLAKEDSGIERRSKLSEGSGRELNDTRSIGSLSSKDFANSSMFTERQSTGAQSQVLELMVEGQRMSDIEVDIRLSNLELEAIVKEALDNVVPSLRNSSFRGTTLIKTGRGNTEKNFIGDESQRNKDSEVENVTEECEEVLKSPEYSRRGKFSLRSNLKNKISKKSASAENMMRPTGKGNSSEESRYLRALSEFTSTEQRSPLSSTNYRAESPVACRPQLPPRFSNQDNRRKTAAVRLDRLYSTLSNAEDNKMYQENREKFILEMESGSAGSSEEKNRSVLKPPSYSAENTWYSYLLTSDEDSS